MAQTTLPAPHPSAPAPTRRRAFFGLFDADGWAWAGAKAAFWFVVIIMMLGYIPDRAYYASVQQTVDIGLLVWSPINLCPPSNETLPCPAPAGATLPWHPSPPELVLPAARTDGLAAVIATNYLYIGGSDGTAATKSVYVSHPVGFGNIDKWTAGPDLPEPRSGAAFVVVGSTVYVIGGYDAAGAPTSTVFSLASASDGTLGAWKTEDSLKLPEPRGGASAVIVSDGFVVMGGRGPNGPTKNVWKTQLTSNVYGPWTEQTPLYEAIEDAVAVHVGDVIFVMGGRNDSGKVVATVQQGLVGGARATVADPNQINALWRVSEQTNLPGPRTDMSGFTVNGGIYVQGGNDGTTPRTETLWTTPSAGGVIPGWQHLPQTDLGQGIEGSAAFTAGANAFLVAGTTTSGVTNGLARAYLAPQLPFFQLGILGMTIPALKLDGEIGQQLGYLNAAGVGTINFIILLLIGWGFAHKERVREMAARFRRRRKD